MSLSSAGGDRAVLTLFPRGCRCHFPSSFHLPHLRAGPEVCCAQERPGLAGLNATEARRMERAWLAPCFPRTLSRGAGARRSGVWRRRGPEPRPVLPPPSGSAPAGQGEAPGAGAWGGGGRFLPCAHICRLLEASPGWTLPRGCGRCSRCPRAPAWGLRTPLGVPSTPGKCRPSSQPEVGSPGRVRPAPFPGARFSLSPELRPVQSLDGFPARV